VKGLNRVRSGMRLDNPPMRFEVLKHAKKERGQYPAILTEQPWSTRNLPCGKRTQFCGTRRVKDIIIHQTHYEKSDWSRAFNQFTIACEPDMINAISAADIAFIMSSSTSAWLLSPLECSPQKQNG